MRKKIVLLFTALATIAFQACKSTSDNTTKTKPYERKPITEVKAEDLKIDALAIDAKSQVELGNYDEAIALYQTIIKQKPDYAVAYYELGNLYYAFGRIDLAIAATEKADQIAKNNEWYKIQLTELYRKTDNSKKLIGVYNELIKLKPSVLEYYYALGNAYTLSGKITDAIGVFNRVEKMVGVTEPVSLQKQKLWNAVGEKEKALKEVERLSETYPQERKYYAIMAEQYMQQKQYPKALENYNKMLALDTTDEYIHISLAEYYKKTGDSEKAYRELKKGFQNPKLDIRSKRQILGAFYDSEEFYTTKSQYAFDLAETLISQDPDSASYSVFYGDILMRQKKYERASVHFRKYLETDSTENDVWEALVHCDNEIGNDSLLLSDSRRASKIFPTEPLYYYMQGFVLGNQRKYTEAIGILEKSLSCGFSNPFLEYAVYATLGDFYHEVGDNANSDLNYSRYLEKIPDEVSVLNNYAYFLAERGENLDSACRMSKKTVDKEPENATYLDTYAWILYKMQRYPEAEVYMQKALGNSKKESATLYHHYSQILKALGKDTESEKASAKWLELKLKEEGLNVKVTAEE